MEIRACPLCQNKSYRLKYTEQMYKVVICNKCGLAYLLNPPSEDNIYEDYFKKIKYKSKDYFKNSTSQPLADLFDINERRLKAIQQIKQNGRLLDIGCGLGFFLKSATEAGFNVTGLDVSERAVKFAEKYYNLRVRVGTISDLLIREEKFDIITLWHVLEHFSDPFVELKKIGNLLSNSGVLFIEVPNLHSLKFILSKNKWVGGNHPRYHRTFFNRRTLALLLKEAGFANIQYIHPDYSNSDSGLLKKLAKRVLNKVSFDSFLTCVAMKD